MTDNGSNEQLEVGPVVANPRHPFRIAMETRDRPAVVRAFAENAVVRSPFTDNMTFVGHQQLDALVAVILEVLEDLTYVEELHTDGAAVLVGCARVDGLRIEFVDYLKLRGDSLIEEMTVFFRPLPATTAAMRRVGAGLGRRQSKLRGRIVRAMTAPMAVMARTGDRVGVALLRQ